MKSPAPIVEVWHYSIKLSKKELIEILQTAYPSIPKDAAVYIQGGIALDDKGLSVRWEVKK